MNLIFAVLVTAFFSHEIETGQTKQCIYDTDYGTYVQTMDITDLCPLELKVDM